MNSRRNHSLPKLIKLLLVLYFAITPLDYVLPHIGNATMLVPVGALIAILCFGDVIYTRRWHIRVNQEEFVIVWLVFLCIASALWAENYSAAYTHTISFLLTGAIYFLLMSYEYSAEDIRLVEIGSIIGGALLVVYVFTKVNLGLVFAGYRLDFDNIGGGAFSDPNGLAGRLMMPFLFSLKRVFNKGKYSKRMVCLVVCGLVLSLILLTGSRGGILAIGIALLVLINAYVKKKRFGILLGMLVLAGIAAMYLPGALPEHIYSRIFSYAKYREVMILEGDRIDIWSHVILDLFPEAPILGYGAGNSSIALIEFYGRVKAVHNSHLVFLAELGLLGFVPWMAYMFGKFRNAVAVKRENPFCLAVFLSVIIMSALLDAAREKYLWNMLLYVYMNYVVFVRDRVKNDTKGSEGYDSASDSVRVFSP